MNAKIVPLKVMSSLFTNKKNEVLPLSEIIYNKTIKEVSFYCNFLTREKKCFFGKTIKIFQKSIFIVTDKKVFIYPREDETIIYFSSVLIYDKFVNYDRIESYRVDNTNLPEGFAKKYEIHFPTKNILTIDWD